MTAGKKFKRLIRQRAARTGSTYAAARQQLLRRVKEQTTMSEVLVPARLDSVKTLTSGAHQGEPVAFLAEIDGPRMLGIVIGKAEASAIANALQGVELSRPMTHDAFSRTVEALGRRIDRVEIRATEDRGMYLATAKLAAPEVPDVSLDCRPSDALALSVRQSPPPTLLVEDRLMTDYSTQQTG